VRYAVTVRNAGRSAAPRSLVAAMLPGDATPNGRQRSVPRLLPGASAVVAFTGHGCAAGDQPASFVADPANAIEEADEANNAIAATCPAP
jgi:subtilase family serine protease